MLRFDNIFIFTLVFSSLRAECPGLEDIKDMQNDQTFTCARFYYGWGHDLGVRGCNGCSISEYADIPHGMDLDAGKDKHYPMGSIMVKPGCTLYVFHDNNFGGNYDKYEGPTILSRVSKGAFFSESEIRFFKPSDHPKNYSKKLVSAWNLKFLPISINNLFKFQAQDSFLE